MKRREFGQRVVGAAIGASVAGASGLTDASAQGSRTPRRNALMHVGGDYHSVAGASITSRSNLEYNLRYGVKHLTVQAKNGPEGGSWDLDVLKRMKDDCDQSGVQLEAIRMEPTYIALPKGAERVAHMDLVDLSAFAQSTSKRYIPTRERWIFSRSCGPDHMPHHSDDPGSLQSFAFGYG